MIAENKPKNKGGRPRALTPEKQEILLTVITHGGSRKMASKCAGIDYTTIADEAKRNPEFSARLDKAEGESYHKHVMKITGSRDWKASAWFLARKYPEEWSEVQKVAQTTTDGKDLTPEQRERAIAAILEKRFGSIRNHTE